MPAFLISEMALAKKHWRTTIPGICCIAAGVYDVILCKGLNPQNIACFAAGWGLIKAADADSKPAK